MKLKVLLITITLMRRVVFHDGDIANTTANGYRFEVIHPKTGRPCKIPPKGFRFPEESLRKMIADGDIMFGEDETTLIKPKNVLKMLKMYCVR